MLSYQAHSKPPRQRQAFHAVKNEVLHLFPFPFNFPSFVAQSEGKESRKRGHGGKTKRGKGDVSPLDEHSRPFCGVSPDGFCVWMVIITNALNEC